jgi:hypothetical protein
VDATPTSEKKSFNLQPFTGEGATTQSWKIIEEEA